MKQVYFTFLIVIFCIIQNAINGKFCRKPKKTNSNKQLPPYVKTPSNIKIYISNKLDGKEIYDILYNFHYLSCMHFNVHRTPLKKMGINFFYSKNTDKVILSTSSKKPTKVYLKKSTVKNKKELTFYIGLALGMIPEISRYDRDEHVKVFFKNISHSMQHYFKIKKYNDETIANTGFDFSSAMFVRPHYGSKNKKLTYMSHLYPYYENSLKIFKYYSYNDIKRVNYLYCRNHCNKINDCKNGGYYGLKCDRCNCPPGFNGRTCEQIGPISKGCDTNNELFSSSHRQELLVKNGTLFCVYSIKSKKGKKIQLTILDLKLSLNNHCKYGIGMEVKYGKDKGAIGLLLCNDKHKNIKLPALSSEIAIIFGNHQPNNTFKVSYQEVN